MTSQFNHYFDVFDGNLGEESWLFEQGWIFSDGNGRFFLSLRGHILDGAHDIARWIREDVGIQAKLSDKNDIVAYEIDTPEEVIKQVLSICNSAEEKAERAEIKMPEKKCVKCKSAVKNKYRLWGAIKSRSESELASQWRMRQQKNSAMPLKNSALRSSSEWND